jgi:hypothetical protein
MPGEECGDDLQKKVKTNGEDNSSVKSKDLEQEEAEIEA